MIPKCFRGFHIMLSIGRYCGFKIAASKATTRIVLGWAAICFGRLDMDQDAYSTEQAAREAAKENDK